MSVRLEGQALQGSSTSENVPVTLQTGEADEKLESVWPHAFVYQAFIARCQRTAQWALRRSNVPRACGPDRLRVQTASSRVLRDDPERHQGEGPITGDGAAHILSSSR